MMIRAFHILVWMLAAPAAVFAQEVAQSPAEPPQKPEVESVEITGNDQISMDRLQRVMLLRESSFFNNVRFDETIFKGDLESIILFYQRNGYLQAHVVSAVVDTFPENKVGIKIDVGEGSQTLLDGIGFTGNRVFPDSELRGQIALQSGDPYRRTDIDDATTQLLRFYADHGYLESNIDAQVQVDDATHRASVTFDITERDGFRIGDIRIEGLEKTKQRIVTRELQFHAGDMVNYSRLLRSQRELYLTGLFRSVYVRPVAAAVGDSTRRDILIDLVENDSGEFNVSVGYDTIERLRTRLEVLTNNFRGTAVKMGASAKWSVKQNTFGGSLTDPRFLNTRWQTDLNVTRDFIIEPGYSTRSLGGAFTIGRKFQQNSRINFTYRYDLNKYFNLKLSELPEDKKSNISSFRTSFVYDTRNNLFNTTQGFYFELSNEYGGFFVGNAKTFDRIVGIVKYFYPASDVLVLGSAIELGVIDSQGGLSRIPLSERFYAGGPSSIRGFSYRKVGPLDDNLKPVGGSIKLVWNVLEARRNLWRWLNGAVFYDLGNVWTGSSQLNLRDIRHGAGVGLRISTPIGLARIDYGFKLDKRAGEDRTELYFSMGQAF